MTAGSVIIKNKTGSVSVDLTGSAGVHFVGYNPLIIIPIPADVATPTTWGGAESWDLKMLTDNIIISFALGYTGVTARDALGANFGTGVPASDFEKLRYLFKYDTDRKQLTVGTNASPIWCVITNLDVNIPPGTLDSNGKMSSDNCSMTLTVVNQDAA
jgi:hypothetical protein